MATPAKVSQTVRPAGGSSPRLSHPQSPLSTAGALCPCRARIPHPRCAPNMPRCATPAAQRRVAPCGSTSILLRSGISRSGGTHPFTIVVVGAEGRRYGKGIRARLRLVVPAAVFRPECVSRAGGGGRVRQKTKGRLWVWCGRCSAWTAPSTAWCKKFRSEGRGTVPLPSQMWGR